MARQKAMYVGRSFLLQGEESIAEFLVEVAVQVEFSSARVDHHFAGVVVEKKRHVHALASHFHPSVASAFALPLPGDGTEVIAAAFGNRRNHSVWADGKAAELDQSKRRGANFGNRGIEKQVPALQQAKALNEQIDSHADSDDAPTDGANRLGRIQNQRNEDQLDWDQGSARWGDLRDALPASRLAERKRGWQQKTAQQAYVGNGIWCGCKAVIPMAQPSDRFAIERSTRIQKINPRKIAGVSAGSMRA